jgi:hypothetical protein
MNSSSATAAAAAAAKPSTCSCATSIPKVARQTRLHPSSQQATACLPRANQDAAFTNPNQPASSGRHQEQARQQRPPAGWGSIWSSDLPLTAPDLSTADTWRCPSAPRRQYTQHPTTKASRLRARAISLYAGRLKTAALGSSTDATAPKHTKRCSWAKRRPACPHDPPCWTLSDTAQSQSGEAPIVFSSGLPLAAPNRSTADCWCRPYTPPTTKASRLRAQAIRWQAERL